MKISAIILSAGSSHRMGKHKALLTIDKKTFLQHIIDVVESAGVKNTVVVLGFEAQTIRETLSSFCGTIIINEEWKTGQLSSIIAGMNALNKKECNGMLICPVDHPLITTMLVEKLLQAFYESNKQIVVPTYCGRRGHPIIISSALFPEIKNASVEVGLRSVVHAHEKNICEVPTEEEGILINIDTPEDYQQYIHHGLYGKSTG